MRDFHASFRTGLARGAGYQLAVGHWLAIGHWLATGRWRKGHPEMDPIRIGIVGCGDITRSHLWGYWALGRMGRDDFRIAAVCSRTRKHCDQYAGRHAPRAVPAQHEPTAEPRRRAWNAGPIGLLDLPHGRPADYHADWRALVARDDLDLIEIHLPPALHHAVAIAALRAGKHVLVEKPMALTVRGGAAIVDAAQVAGRRLSVGLNLRFDPFVRAAQWMIESGQLGQPSLFHALTLRSPGHWRRPVGSRLRAAMEALRDKVLYRRPDAVSPPLGSEWRYLVAEAGAGELSENGVHQMDIARALCGDIARCSGLIAQLQPLLVDAPGGARAASETADTYFSLLRFKSGALGQTGISAAAHGEGSPVRENFRVHGEHGSVSQSRYQLRNGRSGDPWELFASEAPPALREAWFPGGLTHRFALHKLDMLEAIRGKRAPLTSGESGLTTLAACAAIAESSLLGREVAPEEMLALRPSAFQDPIDRALGLLPGAQSPSAPIAPGAPGALDAAAAAALRTGSTRRA